MSKPAYARKDLERVIDEGGSVLHRGQLIVSKDQLPTEADLKAAHEGRERVEAPTAKPKGKPPAPGDPPGSTAGDGSEGATTGEGSDPPKE